MKQLPRTDKQGSKDEETHQGFGTFLDELKARGIATGPYNLPDWEDCPEGLCTWTQKKSQEGIKR